MPVTRDKPRAQSEHVYKANVRQTPYCYLLYSWRHSVQKNKAPYCYHRCSYCTAGDIPYRRTSRLTATTVVPTVQLATFRTEEQSALLLPPLFLLYSIPGKNDSYRTAYVPVNSIKLSLPWRNWLEDVQ